MPVFGNGDILSYEDYKEHRENTGVSGCMIARFVAERGNEGGRGNIKLIQLRYERCMIHCFNLEFA